MKLSPKVVKAILKSPEVSVDTETGHKGPAIKKVPPPLNCRLKGVSISWTHEGHEWSHYWSFNSEEMPQTVAAARWEKFRRRLLQPLFNRKAVMLAFHNASYDLKVFYARGLWPKTKRISDTMIMDFLLDENRPHDLKTCAKDHLGAEGAKSHAATQKEIANILKEAKKRVKEVQQEVWEVYRDYHKDLIALDDLPEGYIRDLVARLPEKTKKDDVMSVAMKEVGKRILSRARKKAIARFHNYARKDALWTLQLHKYYLPLIQAEGFGQIYWNLYQNVMRQAIQMEIAGVKVDLPKLKEIRDLLQGQLAKIEKKIRKQFGQEFNPASAPQVKNLLWKVKKLKPPPWLKPGDYGKDGLPGSGEEIIEWLVEQGHTFLTDLLVRRKLSKTLGTYVLPLIEEAEADPEGRIHTSFSIIKRTSRWGSSDPNLQNIPRWDTLKKYIPDCPSLRACFVAPKGHVLLVADYSQCDLRVMAHATRDPAFVKSYRTWKCPKCKKKGETNKPYHACPVCGEPDKEGGGKFKLGADIHMQTAKSTGLVAKRGSKQGRQDAKEVNFGAIYLMGAFTLAKQIDTSNDEASEVLNAYHSTHPGVRAYANHIFEVVKAQGYFRMLNGQKRRFNRDLEKLDVLARAQGEEGRRRYNRQKFALMREIMNNTGQGGTAVIINTAMFLLWRKRKYLKKYGCRLLLQVHDELVFEAPKEHEEKVKVWIRATMEQAGKLVVPVLADINSGPNWQEAK